MVGIISLIETRCLVSCVLDGFALKDEFREKGLKFTGCSTKLLLSLLIDAKKVAEIRVVVHGVRHYFVAQTLKLLIPDIEQVILIESAEAQKVVSEDGILRSERPRIFSDVDIYG